MVRIGSSHSSICNVTSGVIQGSVLGPLLFNIFINDITDSFDSNITTAKLFADDIKLCTNVTLSSTNDLQNQLDGILKWSHAWQLPISFSKCTILHLGNRNSQHQYRFLNEIISRSDVVRDLGIIVDPNLKFIDHIRGIVSRAHLRASQIIRCFLSRNLPLMTRAFTTYVRPTLEYASVTWSPSQITQIILFEGVQRTFSKRLPGLANLSYAESISILKLQSLEHRRLICDLIETYKIIHNLSTLQFDDFFSYPTCNSTRGHPFRLSVPVAKIDARKHFFACRVVPIRNFLPNNVVMAQTLQSFKNLVRLVDLSKFLVFPTYI